MAKSEIREVGGGAGPLSLLGVLFVGLKLTGYINWSWWWVTAPFWGPIAILFSIAAFALIGAGIAFLLVKLFDK